MVNMQRPDISRYSSWKRVSGALAWIGCSTLVACNASDGDFSGMPQEADFPDRPNILWVSVEDISPLLGVYGDPVAETPVLDQFAEDGVRYTRAFTTAAVCAPSRAAIITGMHQASIGAHQHRTNSEGPGLTPYLTVPPPHVKAFTEYLRAAGYYTTNRGKTDYQFADFRDMRQPLTAWDESGPDAHWRNAPEGKPFFHVVNLMTTHESRIWPNLRRPLAVDPDDELYSDKNWPQEKKNIAAMITRLDRDTGRLLGLLNEKSIAENTVVFFTSDNGPTAPATRYFNSNGPYRRTFVFAGTDSRRPAGKRISVLGILPLQLELGSRKPELTSPELAGKQGSSPRKLEVHSKSSF